MKMCHFRGIQMVRAIKIGKIHRVIKGYFHSKMTSNEKQQTKKVQSFLICIISISILFIWRKNLKKSLKSNITISRFCAF